jgi:hypothetical protein
MLPRVQLALDALELLLRHAEVVPEFVDHGAAHLLANLFIVAADGFNVLLV